jgi:hypothetical protein
VDDKNILSQIDELVAEEHELRSKVTSGSLDSSAERARLRTLEESLDQCWDLLRQRRARKDFGQDPDGAAARPIAEVEGYQQ